MMFTEKELHYLCVLSQHHKLPGFTFDSMLQKDDITLIQNELTCKGILENGIYSSRGLALARFIDAYCKSEVYLRVGSGIFANYFQKEYIMISKKNNEYNVEAINQDYITAVILSKFGKFFKTAKDGEISSKLYTKRMFQKLIDENQDLPALYYNIVNTRKNKGYPGVFFYSENSLQHYVVDREELYIYPKDYIQQGIETIFKGER